MSAQTDDGAGEEKQKRLLASDAGHFSMIKYILSIGLPQSSLTFPLRALHLADLITEMNGLFVSLRPLRPVC